MKQLSFLLLFGFLIVNSANAQTTLADSTAVEECVTNYIQSFYQLKPELFEEAVHTDLAKRKVSPYGEEGDYLQNASFEEMVLLTKVFNKKGHFTADSKAEVTILDMTETTASIKLVTPGWFDYMHLAKMNGEWKIVNVLWDYLKPKSKQP